MRFAAAGLVAHNRIHGKPSTCSVFSRAALGVIHLFSPDNRDSFAARHTCSSWQTVSKPSPPKCRPLDTTNGLRRYPQADKGFRRIWAQCTGHTHRDSLTRFRAVPGPFLSLAEEPLICRNQPW